MRALVLVVALSGIAHADIAHADEPPTWRAAPSIRPTLGKLAIAGGGLAAACFTGAAITSTSDDPDDRDDARGFLGVGIMSGAAGLTSLAHYIWVPDPITDEVARTRAHITRVVGIGMAGVGMGLVLTGTLLLDHASDDVSYTLSYTGLGVTGISVALLVHSMAYREAAASSVVVTPTGRGVALSGTF